MEMSLLLCQKDNRANAHVAKPLLLRRGGQARRAAARRPPFCPALGKGLGQGWFPPAVTSPASQSLSLPLFPVLLCALVLALVPSDPSPREIVGPPGEVGEQRGNPAVSNTSQTMPS